MVWVHDPGLQVVYCSHGEAAGLAATRRALYPRDIRHGDAETCDLPRVSSRSCHGVVLWR